MWERFIQYLIYVFDWNIKHTVTLYRDSDRNPVTFMNRLLGDTIYDYFNRPVELVSLKHRVNDFKTSIHNQEGWYEFAVIHYRAIRRFERFRFQNLYVFQVWYRGPLGNAIFLNNTGNIISRKMWQNLSPVAGVYHVSRGYDNDYERIAKVIDVAKRREGSGFEYTLIPSLLA